MSTPADNNAREAPHAGEQSAPQYRLENQIGYLLRRANQRHTALFAQHFAENGLTTLQFAVLITLFQRGEISQNELGRATAMDPNTIQGVVQRLTGRGLVERRRSTTDRRRVLLALSETGRALARDLESEGFEISKQTLLPLTDDEQRVLMELLRKVV